MGITGLGSWRKWKSPIQFILRVRRSANDKEHLVHDPMDREVCDMDQVEFSVSVFLTKGRKKPAKRLQRSAMRKEREQNGSTTGLEAFNDADSWSLIGNIDFDRVEEW